MKQTTCTTKPGVILKDFLKSIDDIKSNPGTVSALGGAISLAAKSVGIETAVDASNEGVKTTVEAIDTASTVIEGATTVADITTSLLL